MHYTKPIFLLVWKLILLVLLAPLSAAAKLMPICDDITEKAVLTMRSGISGIHEFVREQARAGVRRMGMGDADAISRVILHESERAGFDPILITALIEHESGFGVRMRGSHGEIGLMQVKPSTARWLSRIAGIPYSGASSLEDPATNIRIGTAYLSFLRERFAATHWFLAAYNMGPRQAARVFSRRLGSGPYARTVLRRYRRFNSQLRVDPGMASV